MKLKLGAPQESILGPPLFILFVNDSSSVFEDNIGITGVQYADNTNFIIRAKNTSPGIRVC